MPWKCCIICVFKIHPCQNKVYRPFPKYVAIHFIQSGVKYNTLIIKYVYPAVRQKCPLLPVISGIGSRIMAKFVIKALVKKGFINH